MKTNKFCTVAVMLVISFLFAGTANNAGKIQIHKKSQLGRTLLDALDTNKKIEIKI